MKALETYIEEYHMGKYDLFELLCELSDSIHFDIVKDACEYLSDFHYEEFQMNCKELLDFYDNECSKY